MIKIKSLGLALLLLPLAAANAQGKPDGGGEPKMVSGISIVGNNEAPKSLYIVPWKSSEVGDGAQLKSSLLNEGMVPVDRDVFKRELEFFELSNAN